jgi:hypothetical protein
LCDEGTRPRNKQCNDREQRQIRKNGRFTVPARIRRSLRPVLPSKFTVTHISGSKEGERIEGHAARGPEILFARGRELVFKAGLAGKREVCLQCYAGPMPFVDRG